MRVRQHVNPLGLRFTEFRGEPPPLTAGRAVEVEVGCADAQCLFERAAQDPARIYLGIDVRRSLIEDVNRRARAGRLPVYGVFCNANHHLDRVVPAQRASRVFLNFPDPWFKRRHRKRRMLDARLVTKLHRILEPGGDLWFQSDVWEVALEALGLFEQREDWFENLAGPWSFWRKRNPYSARSCREAYCERRNLQIWRLRYRALA